MPPVTDPPVCVIHTESRRTHDRPAMGRAWHAAMQRWQRAADRACARAAAHEDVELTDLDPELCMARGWQ